MNSGMLWSTVKMLDFVEHVIRTWYIFMLLLAASSPQNWIKYDKNTPWYKTTWVNIMTDCWMDEKLIVSYKIWQTLSTMTWSFSSIIHNICRFSSGCFFTLSVSSRGEKRSENQVGKWHKVGAKYPVINVFYFVLQLTCRILGPTCCQVYCWKCCIAFGFCCILACYIHLSSSAWSRNHYLIGKCHALDSRFFQWKALSFFEQMEPEE